MNELEIEYMLEGENEYREYETLDEFMNDVANDDPQLVGAVNIYATFDYPGAKSGEFESLDDLVDYCNSIM